MIKILQSLVPCHTILALDDKLNLKNKIRFITFLIKKLTKNIIDYYINSQKKLIVLKYKM